MTGRREKKKKIAREKILKAATDIFNHKGFEKASVSEIAEKADLGVGTVYNYFKSKDDIFVETFTNQMDVETTYEFDIKELVEKEVADIVIAYVEKFTKPFKLVPKKFMQELFRITIGSKNNTSLLRNLMEMDFKFIDRIEEILEKIKSEGILPESFDPRIAAEMVYGAYMYEVMMYLFMDDYSFDKALETSKVKIRFLFEKKA